MNMHAIALLKGHYTLELQLAVISRVYWKKKKTPRCEEQSGCRKTSGSFCTHSISSSRRTAHAWTNSSVNAAVKVRNRPSDCSFLSLPSAFKAKSSSPPTSITASLPGSYNRDQEERQILKSYRLVPNPAREFSHTLTTFRFTLQSVGVRQCVEEETSAPDQRKLGNTYHEKPHATPGPLS